MHRQETCEPSPPGPQQLHGKYSILSIAADTIADIRLKWHYLSGSVRVFLWVLSDSVGGVCLECIDSAAGQLFPPDLAIVPNHTAEIGPCGIETVLWRGEQ